VALRSPPPDTFPPPFVHFWSPLAFLRRIPLLTKTSHVLTDVLSPHFASGLSLLVCPCLISSCTRQSPRLFLRFDSFLARCFVFFSPPVLTNCLRSRFKTLAVAYHQLKLSYRPYSFFFDGLSAVANLKVFLHFWMIETRDFIVLFFFSSFFCPVFPTLFLLRGLLPLPPHLKTQGWFFFPFLVWPQSYPYTCIISTSVVVFLFPPLPIRVIKTTPISL